MRLTSGQQEIFFVATPDDSKEYTFELDVAESAKEFAMTSGTYTLVSKVYSRSPGTRNHSTRNSYF